MLLLEDAGLTTIAVKAMFEHYVRTVDAWIDNLETHWDAAIALIGEEAARVWRLYLAGGRLAFAQGRMGVDRILLIPASGDLEKDPRDRDTPSRPLMIPQADRPAAVYTMLRGLAREHLLMSQTVCRRGP